jgi:hypothetical protein
VSCGDDAIETDVEGDASVSVGVGGKNEATAGDGGTAEEIDRRVIRSIERGAPRTETSPARTPPRTASSSSSELELELELELSCVMNESSRSSRTVESLRREGGRGERDGRRVFRFARRITF